MPALMILRLIQMVSEKSLWKEIFNDCIKKKNQLWIMRNKDTALCIKIEWTYNFEKEYLHTFYHFSQTRKFQLLKHVIHSSFPWRLISHLITIVVILLDRNATCQATEIESDSSSLCLSMELSKQKIVQK
jgi:hypothetical protein